MTHYPLRLLPLLFALLLVSCDPDQGQSDSDRNSIVIDEVDTAYIKKANLIVIDEVDTAYVGNSKALYAEKIDCVYVNQTASIVIDEVDTARIGKVQCIVIDEVDTALFEVKLKKPFNAQEIARQVKASLQEQ